MVVAGSCTCEVGACLEDCVTTLTNDNDVYPILQQHTPAGSTCCAGRDTMSNLCAAHAPLVMLYTGQVPLLLVVCVGSGQFACRGDGCFLF